MNKRILLVDDELDFLEILGEFLEDEGYDVATAMNGERALAELEKDAFDLLLSDINMPGMKGFELLEKANKLYPDLRRALITAYDVRDYLVLAKEHDIGNIITKTTPFNFEEVRVLVKSVLTGDVFGIDRYVKGDIQTRLIKRTDQIEHVVNEASGAAESPVQQRKMRQALGEIVVNAFFYGARRERGDQKDKWKFEGELAEGEEIVVSWGVDEEKFGASVQDQKGRLSKQEVLYWLERNTSKGPDGLSVGLMDEHGKGIYIARETIDRFIINIKKNFRTEVLLLNYSQGLYDGHRPLWIQEV